MLSRLKRRRWRATAVAAAVGVAATVATVASPSAAAPVAATGGSVEWGVKASFRGYVTSPIGHGTITTAGGATQAASGVFTFPVSGGAHDADTGTTEAISGGSVHFEAHGGILDVLISDVRVEIDGSTGAIVADVVSREFIDTTTAGDPVTYDDVVLASLDLAGVTPTVGVGTVSYADVPATLTAAGVPAFGNFYSAGEPLDPVSFTLELAGDEGPTVPTDPSDPTDAEGSLTWKVSEHAWTSSSLAPAHEAGAPAVKDADDGWVFPVVGTPSYDESTGSVDVSFAGSLTLGNVNQGGYRIRLADPQLTVDADGAGALIADVSYCTGSAGSAPCSGPWASQDDVTVVAFDVEDDAAVVSATGGTFTLTVTPPWETANREFAPELMAFLSPASPPIAPHFRASGSSSDESKPPAPLTVTLTYDDGGPGAPGGGGVSDSIDITTEVLSGDLTISIDDDEVVLPSPVLNAAGTALETSGVLPDVRVTDTRAVNPGWNVNAQITDFNGPTTVDGKSLGWAPEVRSASVGQLVTAGAAVAPGTGISGTSLGSSAPGAGLGTAVLGADLLLQVPTDALAGSYTATLTLTAI